MTSEPGRGSTFHIYLPIQKGQAASIDATPGKKTRAGTGHRATILYAEDEVRQVYLMQRLLEGQGFRVLTARDGAEAIDLHLRHKEEIAVAILDLGLAKLNGWEALQKMKKINPNVKGILASGYLSPEVKSHVAEGFLSGLIQNPYHIDEVLKKIETAIRS